MASAGQGRHLAKTSAASAMKPLPALMTPEGAIYSGGNVENASYPEGWCAETSAIAAMAAAGARRIAEIAPVSAQAPWG